MNWLLLMFFFIGLLVLTIMLILYMAVDSNQLFITKNSWTENDT